MPDSSTHLSPPTPAGPHRAAHGEDAALFGRFLAGDNDAFLGLFRQYDRSLRLYCRRVLGDHEMADDIVQETWKRVVEMRGEKRSVERPAGLLYRIARNRCIDHLRRAQKRISIDEMPPQEELRGSAEVGEMQEAIVEGLEALPFEAREVLVLHHYCGYRFDEIAAMLERTPEAIWARASRARKHLRSIVTSIMEGRSSSTSTSNPLHRAEKNHESLS